MPEPNHLTFSSLHRVTAKLLLHGLLDAWNRVKLPWKRRRKQPRKHFSDLDSGASPFSTMEASHQLKHIFRFFDSNGDGKISPSELSEVLVSLDQKKKKKKMAAKEAEGIVREMDRNGDGAIDLDEFISAMIDTGNVNGLCREDDDLMMDVFLVFDRDMNGHISAKELQRVMVRLGCENCSLRECRQMIEGVDRNGDGFVDFEEFKSMMTG